LHSEPSIIKAIKSKRKKLAEDVARMGEMRTIFGGKPEGKRSLGRSRRRSEKRYYKWGRCVDWIHLVGFEVLTAVSTKMAVFWVVEPCSLVEVYQRSRSP
jgi:hypothetical protein